MANTTHFNLPLAVGNELYNPLTIDNPAKTICDTQMYNNQQNATCTATHTKSGTVHALVRSIADIPLFRFEATNDYNSGDTFTVDGNTVTARLPDGTGLPNLAFRTNSSILCILTGTQLTVITNASTVNLADYMKTADYVGAQATGKGKLCENADNANLFAGQPRSTFASASSVSGIIQDVSAIRVLSALPGTPDPKTLYFIKE